MKLMAENIEFVEEAGDVQEHCRQVYFHFNRNQTDYLITGFVGFAWKGETLWYSMIMYREEWKWISDLINKEYIYYEYGDDIDETIGKYGMYKLINSYGLL